MTMPRTSAPQLCPRCHGRLFTDRDRHGAYQSCFACGFVHELVRGPAIDLLAPAAPGQRHRDPSHKGQQL